jgi:hypothetical protein
MADELTIADRALLRIEEVPKEAVLPCLFPGCTLDASRSDQMCARHSAFVLSRRTKAALARQMLEENALQYAADHAKASQMGAEKGDGKAAQWALERLKIVEPIQREDAGPKVVVVVGSALPGLPAPNVTVIEQK